MEQQSDHIYYTLLWRVLGCTVPFTSLNKLCTTGLPKPFCWAKPACFDFSSSNFNFHGHILSTAEAALTSSYRDQVMTSRKHEQSSREWTEGTGSKKEKGMSFKLSFSFDWKFFALCGQYSDLRESRPWVQPALPRNSPSPTTWHRCSSQRRGYHRGRTSRLVQNADL